LQAGDERACAEGGEAPLRRPRFVAPFVSEQLGEFVHELVDVFELAID
jgi:hypothetical protein